MDRGLLVLEGFKGYFFLYRGVRRFVFCIGGRIGLEKGGE